MLRELLRSDTARLIAACVAFSAWLGLLLWGHTLGGLVYLLFVAALVLFPWRALRSSPPS